jgi:hypothetical protein
MDEQFQGGVSREVAFSCPAGANSLFEVPRLPDKPRFSTRFSRNFDGLVTPVSGEFRALLIARIEDKSPCID